MDVYRTLHQGFDPGPLLARLTPAMWELETRRQEYPGSPHEGTKMIAFRWPDMGEEDDLAAALLYTVDSVDTALAVELMPEIGDAVMTVLESVGPTHKLGRVVMTKLPPGGVIGQHTDEGWYADIYDRFHLCLQGDDGNIFACKGADEINPRPGDVFWLNHKHDHSAWNVGDVDRIHLIVDVMAPRFTALRGIVYQEELLSDLWEEIAPLLVRHKEEIARYPDIALDPDKGTYDRLEAEGKIQTYTVRNVRALIGYVIYFVHPNMHYKGSLHANQDVMFVLPEHRRGRTGVELIRYSERRLAERGVQTVYHHVKRTNNLGRLLARLGYEHIEEGYMKRLDILAGEK